MITELSYKLQNMTKKQLWQDMDLEYINAFVAYFPSRVIMDINMIKSA